MAPLNWFVRITAPAMEFTLHYRGPLKANRGPVDKLILRRHFHGQLARLWTQKPLSEFRAHLLEPTSSTSTLNVVRRVAGFNFAPLVAERLLLIAELKIQLLRPEPPGQLVNQGGDIDNRLKTLLDALTVPSSPNALPAGACAEAGEDPFFCLLEDDVLISKLSVSSDRLLEPASSPSDVVALIRVRTKHVGVLMGTLGLA